MVEGSIADSQPIPCLEYQCWKGNGTLENNLTSVAFTLCSEVFRGALAIPEALAF